VAPAAGQLIGVVRVRAGYTFRGRRLDRPNEDTILTKMEANDISMQRMLVAAEKRRLQLM
jgi:hypothetical protein